MKEPSEVPGSLGSSNAGYSIQERDDALEHLRVLSEVSAEVFGAALDYRSLLVLVAKRVSETFGGDLCVIRLLSDDGLFLEASDAAYHPDKDILELALREMAARRERVGQGMAGGVVASRESLFAPVVSREAVAAEYPDRAEIVERLAITGVMVVALLSRGRPIGSISLCRLGSREPLSPRDLSLLERLAGLAAPALTNAGLTDATQSQLAERTRLTERLKFLSEVGRDFAKASADYGSLLRLIATRISEAFGDLCIIRLVSPDGKYLEPNNAVHHPDPDVTASAKAATSRPQPLGEGISGRVAATGESAWEPSVDMDALLAPLAPERREFAALQRITSIIAAALVSESRVIGVVSLSRTDASRPYSRDDLRLLEDLAAQAALSVTNARLLESVKRELRQREQAEEALRKTEAQLLHAQKMEAVGRLAGGIAHDFNNLLSVVLSYSSLLLGDLPEGDPIREDVDEIRKAGERAAALTKQLLAFSRQQVIQPRVLHLAEILGDMEGMLQRVVGADVKLRVQSPESSGRVKADPGQVEQVVMNLVINARDAMPKGGSITLEVADVEIDEALAREHVDIVPGLYVAVRVTDTGVGMDKGTQDRIFEPFFTTKEQGKGTGLGLSTVFGIVKQAGGAILIDSEIGRGTTFKLYFPRTFDEEHGTARPVKIAHLNGKETILLVEDEDQLRLVARGVLQRRGYTVLEARNGAEALVVCKRHSGQIDLLLTDVVMPKMGGADLAPLVEKMRPGIRVLYMSGYTDDALVEGHVLAPGISLLQKPITPEILLRRVREILDTESTLSP